MWMKCMQYAETAQERKNAFALNTTHSVWSQTDADKIRKKKYKTKN